MLVRPRIQLLRGVRMASKMASQTPMEDALRRKVSLSQQSRYDQERSSTVSTLNIDDECRSLEMAYPLKDFGHNSDEEFLTDHRSALAHGARDSQ